MTTEEDVIYDLVKNKLGNMYDSDNDFRSEMNGLTFFYERKLLHFSKNEKQNQFIYDNINDLVSSQYFKGYYVMTAFLNDKEVELDESTWSMYPGYLRNNIPLLLDDIFKDVDDIDWAYTEVGHKIGIELLQLIQPAFDILKKSRKEIAVYGAYKAFIEDERYKGIVTEETHTTILGNPFDLQFLSPQVYMQGQHSTSEQEVWEIYTWEETSGGWVGSCHLSMISSENQKLYLLTISLLNTISKEEKMDLANIIIGRIPEAIRANLQTRLYHLEDFDLLVKRED